MRRSESTVAAGGSGAFAGPGVVDTTLLAAKFGLTPRRSSLAAAVEPTMPTAPPRPSPPSPTNGQGLPNNVPIVAQISNYLAAVHGVANPDALYMISAGANDLLYVQTPGVVVPPTYLTTPGNALWPPASRPCRQTARAPSWCSTSTTMRGWSTRTGTSAPPMPPIRAGETLRRGGLVQPGGGRA